MTRKAHNQPTAYDVQDAIRRGHSARAEAFRDALNLASRSLTGRDWF
ncbi:MAG: hypothetical protein AAF281_06390 [Pseudomonadota bacterium]